MDLTIARGQSNRTSTTQPKSPILILIPSSLTLTPPLPCTPTPNVASPFATTGPKYGIVTVAVGVTLLRLVTFGTVADVDLVLLIPVLVVVCVPIPPFTTLTTLASHCSNAFLAVAVEHGAKFSTGLELPEGTLIGPLTTGNSAEMGMLVLLDCAAVEVGGGSGMAWVPEIRSV